MKSRIEKITPLRAIRLYCRKCSAGTKEVRLCTIADCELFTFRMGRKPKTQRPGNPELTERRRQVVAAARAARLGKCKSGAAGDHKDSEDGILLQDLLLFK